MIVKHAIIIRSDDRAATATRVVVETSERHREDDCWYGDVNCISMFTGFATKNC